MPQKKNNRKPKITQPVKQETSKRMSGMQIAIVVVSVVIVVTMLLGSLQIF